MTHRASGVGACGKIRLNSTAHKRTINESPVRLGSWSASGLMESVARATWRSTRIAGGCRTPSSSVVVFTSTSPTLLPGRRRPPRRLISPAARIRPNRAEGASDPGCGRLLVTRPHATGRGWDVSRPWTRAAAPNAGSEYSGRRRWTGHGAPWVTVSRASATNANSAQDRQIASCHARPLSL